MTDILNQELDLAMEVLAGPADDKSAFNESRVVEKLKLHLIHQGRDKEAKKFSESHQVLKKAVREPAVIVCAQLHVHVSIDNTNTNTRNALTLCLSARHIYLRL